MAKTKHYNKQIKSKDRDIQNALQAYKSALVGQVRPIRSQPQTQITIFDLMQKNS